MQSQFNKFLCSYTSQPVQLEYTLYRDYLVFPVKDRLQKIALDLFPEFARSLTKEEREIILTNISQLVRCNQSDSKLHAVFNRLISHIEDVEKTLEQKLLDHVIHSHYDGPGFQDFLAPNEGNIIGSGNVYQLEGPGVVVSAGTERSFFALIMAKLKSSKANEPSGLVIRDINSNAIDYMNFNILLLRCSETIQEYQKLSMLQDPLDLTTMNALFRKSQTEGIEYIENTYAEAAAPLFKEIESRVQNLKIEKKLKDFYLANYKCWSDIYYIRSRKWCTEKQYLHYPTSPEYFAILQKYAKEGKMLATLGKITDLAPFKNVELALIDASNIYQYSSIDYIDMGKTTRRVKTKVIVTEQDIYDTRYNIYTTISPSKT